MQPIKISIKRQLDANKTINLLFENAKQIMDIEPGFLAALEELLISDEKPETLRAELVSFTAHELVKRLRSVNPYLRINSKQIEKLEKIYGRTWQKIVQTGDIKTTLKEFHYPTLSAWLASLYPEKFHQALQRSATVSPVTYGEYSAELQVMVLGIDVTRIKQPVMDIGCGSQANLVRHLRSRSIEAYGIDRCLEVHESYLEQVDWFEYQFEPGKWGTVVSNMSFTNHLNYAYLHDISQLEHYLLKMKEILKPCQLADIFTTRQVCLLLKRNYLQRNIRWNENIRWAVRPPASSPESHQNEYPSHLRFIKDAFPFLQPAGQLHQRRCGQTDPHGRWVQVSRVSTCQDTGSTIGKTKSGVYRAFPTQEHDREAKHPFFTSSNDDLYGVSWFSRKVLVRK
jgi:hypothetical protein